MKTFKRRLGATLLAALMAVMLPISSFEKTKVSAEPEQDDSEYYVISGYKSTGKIYYQGEGDSLGTGFCLDAKANTPSRTRYDGRVLLSELEGYTKNYESELDGSYTRVLDEAAKIRLLKLLVNESRIARYSKKLDVSETRAWVLQNLDSDEIDASPINKSTLVTQYQNGELTYDEYIAKVGENFDNNWKYITQSSNDDIIQRLIWCAVHTDDDFPNFVMDRKEYIGGHHDNYYNNEKMLYLSADPINNPHSLWNAFYVPMLDYIDNEFSNPFEEGYDAWVYLTEESNQNMLGTAFMWTEVEVMKTDAATGRSLPGATLQLIDYRGVVCDEWVSTSEAHVCQNLESGHKYTLHEAKPPKGYETAEDITITISKTGRVTSTGTITDGVVLMQDQKGEDEEEEFDLSVSKREVGGGAELAGADLVLYKEEDLNTDGSVKEGAAALDQWTSSDAAHTVTGLLADTDYVLRETAAPEGYETAEDITFIIGEDGSLTIDGQAAEDKIITVRDVAITIDDGENQGGGDNDTSGDEDSDNEDSDNEDSDDEDNSSDRENEGDNDSGSRGTGDDNSSGGRGVGDTNGGGIGTSGGNPGTGAAGSLAAVSAALAAALIVSRRKNKR